MCWRIGLHLVGACACEELCELDAQLEADEFSEQGMLLVAEYIRFLLESLHGCRYSCSRSIIAIDLPLFNTFIPICTYVYAFFPKYSASVKLKI